MVRHGILIPRLLVRFQLALFPFMEGNNNKTYLKEEKCMFIKEELLKLTNANLVAMCKERGIPVYKGKTKMNKNEMVDNLIAFGKENPTEEEVTSPELKEELKEVIEKAKENPIYYTKDVEDVTKVTPWIIGDKDEFIENAQVGTLMAFLDGKGKPRSGKMVNRSAKRREVKLVTEYDAEFIVSYDSILWVKNGSRWPKMVYQMLKEYKNGKSFVVAFKGEESTESSN